MSQCVCLLFNMATLERLSSHILYLLYLYVLTGEKKKKNNNIQMMFPCDLHHLFLVITISFLQTSSLPLASVNPYVSGAVTSWQL